MDSCLHLKGFSAGEAPKKDHNRPLWPGNASPGAGPAAAIITVEATIETTGKFNAGDSDLDPNAVRPQHLDRAHRTGLISAGLTGAVTLADIVSLSSHQIQTGLGNNA